MPNYKDPELTGMDTWEAAGHDVAAGVAEVASRTVCRGPGVLVRLLVEALGTGSEGRVPRIEEDCPSEERFRLRGWMGGARK